MSELNEFYTNLLQAYLLNKSSGNNPERDSFGRLRMSDPYTLFDSKLLGDNRAIFWDDQEVSGSGTSSTYSRNRASELLEVSADTAGRRVRQTKQRFNYQPGKSLEIFLTGVIGEGEDGITKAWGYFDDDNGVFFRQKDGVIETVIRSNATGTPVDTAIEKDDWNIDRFDSYGPSGKTLDITKSQIFVIDIEWLGVGSVRFGVVIDGVVYYVHQFNHANSLDAVYMSTPNLPIRFEISNDGTGAANSVEEICTTVISEGGIEPTGIIRGVSTEDNVIDANTAGQVYAALGIRLKSTHLDNIVQLEKFSVIATTNDDFEWLILLNPTVAGTFTYSAQTNSAVETAVGATANTVTGGIVMSCGYGKAGSVITDIVDSLYYLGSTIDGTRDEMVLCVRSLSSNGDFYASLVWKENA